jgi:hypothetical protein
MVKQVALLFGIVFLLIAILGFMGSGMSMEADPALAYHIAGLFPVNALHNAVHLLFGIWGLVASRSASSSVQFAKIAGGIYVLLAILGFIVPTTFGLIPIGGHDIWLHAVIGVVLLTIGLQAPKTATI